MTGGQVIAAEQVYIVRSPVFCTFPLLSTLTRGSDFDVQVSAPTDGCPVLGPAQYALVASRSALSRDGRAIERLV